MKNVQAYLFAESTVFFAGYRFKVILQKYNFLLPGQATIIGTIAERKKKIRSILHTINFAPFSFVIIILAFIASFSRRVANQRAYFSSIPDITESVSNLARYSRRTIALSQDIRNANQHQISVSSRIYGYIRVRVATRRAYLLDTASRLRHRHLNVLYPRALERLQEFKPRDIPTTSRCIADSNDETNLSHIST